MSITKENKFLLIGAGLPRNGTMSTKHALEIILPGKCYHMIEAFKHQETWAKIIKGEMSDEEFKNFFITNGFVSAVDAPFSTYYERAMKIFPDAKVLLNIRDGNAWGKSMKETICRDDNNKLQFPLNIFAYFGLFSIRKRTILDEAMSTEKVLVDMLESCRNGTHKEFYDNWVEKVKRTVPQDKLLIFSVQEGWEPLCKFLDVPVPSVPFPRVNDSAKFQNRILQRKVRGWILLYEFISIPALCYFFYKQA